MHLGRSEDGGFPRLVKTRVDAELIDLVEDLKFPEFSNDGQYLTVHYLDEMKEKLGGPEEDFENLFTARMLLLLESTWLYNQDVYDEVVREVIGSYYRDFHDHTPGFKPLFLTNDIVRFWKTLCLNYEHRRNRPTDDPQRKAKDRVKNLKLKFSRMLTCFSTVAVLLREEIVPSPEALAEIVRKTPMERLVLASEDVGAGDDLVDKIRGEYAWFLEKTGRGDEEVREWFSDKAVRNDAFDRGRAFGQSIYDLIVLAAGDTETVRYLLV